MYLVDVGPVHDDRGAVMSAERHLHDGRDYGHHDGDRDPQVLAVVGQRQGVVTRARRYHP